MVFTIVQNGRLLKPQTIVDDEVTDVLVVDEPSMFGTKKSKTYSAKDLVDWTEFATASNRRTSSTTTSE